MERFQKIIAVFSYGLGCGLYNINEVIELCDNLIEVKDNPPIEIIEASLMTKSKIDDIEHKLMSIIQLINYGEVTECILGLLYIRLTQEECSIEHVIRCTAKILFNTGLCHNKDYYSLYLLEDRYDLYIKGIHLQLDDIFEILHNKLKEYEAYGEEFNKLYVEELNSFAIN